MSRERKVGTLRNQTIIMPDGSEIERLVKNVTQHTSYGPTMYRELGFVRAGGYEHMVERGLEDTYPWSEEYRKTPWTIVEGMEIQKKKKSTRRKPALTSEEKAWLDAAVEWMLLEEYKPAPSVYGGWNLLSATPTTLALDLFLNKRLEYVERGVGQEAPEKLANVWDYYSLESFDLHRKKWVSQVTSSLKRLEKAGIARPIWGAGLRGGEVKEYFHSEYDEG